MPHPGAHCAYPRPCDPILPEYGPTAPPPICARSLGSAPCTPVLLLARASPRIGQRSRPPHPGRPVREPTHPPAAVTLLRQSPAGPRRSDPPSPGAPEGRLRLHGHRPAGGPPVLSAELLDAVPVPLPCAPRVPPRAGPGAANRLAGANRGRGWWPLELIARHRVTRGGAEVPPMQPFGLEVSTCGARFRGAARTDTLQECRVPASQLHLPRASLPTGCQAIGDASDAGLWTWGRRGSDRVQRRGL